jgi:hypothetical protein
MSAAAIDIRTPTSSRKSSQPSTHLQPGPYIMHTRSHSRFFSSAREAAGLSPRTRRRSYQCEASPHDTERAPSNHRKSWSDFPLPLRPGAECRQKLASHPPITTSNQEKKNHQVKTPHQVVHSREAIKLLDKTQNFRQNPRARAPNSR